MDAETRAHVREIFIQGMKRRAMAAQVLSAHGIAVNWKTGHYRGLTAQLAREKVREEQTEKIVFAGAVVGFLVGNGVVVALLDVPGHALAQYALGYLGVLVMAFGSLLLSQPFDIARKRTRSQFLVWLHLAVLGAYFAANVVAATTIVVALGRQNGWVFAAVSGLVRHWWGYALAHGLVLIGAMFLLLTLVAPLIYRHDAQRLYLRNPTAKAVSQLCQCLMYLRSDEVFLRPATRAKLVSALIRLSSILRKGMWQLDDWPDNFMARSMFRQRCVQAGEAVEMMTVWVALPAKTTRADMVDKLGTILEALLSGRYDELPTEPSKSLMSTRSRILRVLGTLRMVAVGLLPLGALLLLGWLGVAVPPEFRGSAYLAATLWLLVAIISTLDVVKPDQAGLFGILVSSLLPTNKENR